MRPRGRTNSTCNCFAITGEQKGLWFVVVPIGQHDVKESLIARSV